MDSRPGSPTGPLWREMPVSRVFLYISFRVSCKRASKYFVKVGIKIMTFLITQCSSTTCNSYLVPNIVPRRLFGPVSFSENSSSPYSPQKTLRSKYRPQKAARSQHRSHQTLQPTIVPRRLFCPVSSSEPCFRSPSVCALLLQPETKWHGVFCCHTIKGTL